MGCDIHMVLEKKVGEKWVGLHSFPYATTRNTGSGNDKYPITTGSGWMARERDYDLFADLAGVRGDSTTGNKPRGEPDDISDLGRLMIDRDGGDGHSHTHMLLTEAWPLFVIHKLGGSIFDTMRKELGMSMFGFEDFDTDETPDTDNYRLIIWFDN